MSQKLSLRELYKRAIVNQYNVILMTGAGLFAATTMSWIPLIIGSGVELLWLVLGADTSFFRRWVIDQQEKEKQLALQKEAASWLEKLRPAYAMRFQELQRLANDIERLVKENPSLKNDLIKDEMLKLGQLLFMYVKMAVIHERLNDFLAEEREGYIQNAIEIAKQALEAETSPEVRSSLEQNLELATKRMKQHRAIETSFKTLSVRMDTLENSFRYLKSHVVGVGGHDELREQIDGLVQGVDFVEDLARETDNMFEAMEADAELKAALKVG